MTSIVNSLLYMILFISLCNLLSNFPSVQATEYRENKIHTGWLDSRIAMRVRAERPPWYLSVVGGALYVCLFDGRTMISYLLVSLEVMYLCWHQTFISYFTGSIKQELKCCHWLCWLSQQRSDTSKGMIYAEMPLLQIILVAVGLKTAW